MREPADATYAYGNNRVIQLPEITRKDVLQPSLAIPFASSDPF